MKISWMLMLIKFTLLLPFVLHCISFACKSTEKQNLSNYLLLHDVSQLSAKQLTPKSTRVQLLEMFTTVRVKQQRI